MNASTTVVDTRLPIPACPSGPAKPTNQLDLSLLSSVSLSVHHPAAIKLEDLPRSPASDCADVEYYTPPPAVILHQQMYLVTFTLLPPLKFYLDMKLWQKQ